PSAPTFTVQRNDPASSRRRRLLWIIVLLVLVLAAVALGFAAGRHSAPLMVAPSVDIPAPVASANLVLAQQVATLKRSQQVAKIAAEDLRHTLADREEQISGLRADVAFYSRLVGSGEQRSGVAVHGVHAQPIKGSHAYNLTVTLTQNARRGKDNSGTLRLIIDGVKDGKLVVLKGTDLGGRNTDNGQAYAFKYFQQLHATVVLPAGFVPNRLRVSVQPKDEAEVQRVVTWADALKSPSEDSHV
ncbi:MAG: hypothetical protein L0H70_10285, partial [Xanthomonadales bacterium]|nr:hypothetical protein [Xanthomonadales bacterium]